MYATQALTARYHDWDLPSLDRHNSGQAAAPVQPVVNLRLVSDALDEGRASVRAPQRMRRVALIEHKALVGALFDSVKVRGILRKA